MRPTQSQLIQTLFFALVLINALWFGFKPLTPDQLSGDQVNIISICQIYDQPGAWAGDLLGQAPEDLRYYTPWYIGFIRLCGKLCGGDYLKAHQWLTFLTILVYVGGWFWFFKLFCRWHVALTMAWLCKGILWPPGNEIWGIAGVWTLLPRTVFVACLPWLIGWAFRMRSRLNGVLVIAGGLGLLAQIHPITGLGCTLVFLATLSWMLFIKRIWPGWFWLIKLVVILMVTFAPYVWTYAKYVLLVGMHAETPIDAQEMAMRIPIYLREPSAYFAKWLSLKWILFFGTAMGVLWVKEQKFGKKDSGELNLSMVVLVFCLFFAFVPFLIQSLMNYWDLKANFAFQLVRNGRLCLIPGFCMWAIALDFLSQKIPEKWCMAIPFGIIAVTIFASANFFPKWPLLGDDIFRQQWPLNQFGPNNPQLEDALKWIAYNTPKDAVFVGPRVLRVFPQRAVIHDMAGAGLLIEGNPDKFQQVCRNERKWKQAENWFERSNLAKEWGAQYILARREKLQMGVLYENSGYMIVEAGQTEKVETLKPEP